MKSTWCFKARVDSSLMLPCLLYPPLVEHLLVKSALHLGLFDPLNMVGLKPTIMSTQRFNRFGHSDSAQRRLTLTTQPMKNKIQYFKEWRLSLWWLFKLHARWDPSTLNQIELNTENQENMEKLEILIYEDGTFCNHIVILSCCQPSWMPSATKSHKL